MAAKANPRFLIGNFVLVTQIHLLQFYFGHGVSGRGSDGGIAVVSQGVPEMADLLQVQVQRVKVRDPVTVLGLGE